MPTPAELEAKFWKALKSDRTALLGLAAGHDGHAQPMTAQIEGDQGGPIWFFSGAGRQDQPRAQAVRGTAEHGLRAKRGPADQGRCGPQEAPEKSQTSHCSRACARACVREGRVSTCPFRALDCPRQSMRWKFTKFTPLRARSAGRRRKTGWHARVASFRRRRSRYAILGAVGQGLVFRGSVTAPGTQILTCQSPKFLMGRWGARSPHEATC